MAFSDMTVQSAHERDGSELLLQSPQCSDVNSSEPISQRTHTVSERLVSRVKGGVTRAESVVATEDGTEASDIELAKAAPTLTMVLLFLVMGILTIVVPIVLHFYYSEGQSGRSAICDSSGNFLVYWTWGPEGYQTVHWAPAAPKWWSASDAFQISVGFGNLTFSNAKLIDIMWDVVSVIYH